MGFLNNSITSIDCVLTKAGRAALAKSDGSFRITQFALSDDEIDYTLYNPNHLSGSAYYGEAIENMPLLEAFPDENQIMKYKLVTLPRGTAKMPVLSIGYQAIILKQGETLSLTPSTLNYLGNTTTYETSGYTATIADARVVATFEGIGKTNTLSTSNVSLGTNISKTVVGTQINIKATTVNTLYGTNTQLKTTLTLVGIDSGARIVVPVTINKITI